METPARIEELYRTTLEPRIAALESLRRSLKGYIIKGLLCVGIPFALFQLSDVFTGGLSPGLAFLGAAVPFALIFVGVGVAGFKYLIPGVVAHGNYRAKFKADVNGEVFKIVCPTATYQPNEGIATADFEASGLFAARGGFTSDDRVRGRIGQTAFEAAEVRRKYRTSGKNSTTVTVFHGLFFHLDFNKTLRGVTIVDPEGRGGCVRGDRDGLTRVALESPLFEQVFEVYASDEVEARYVLTPAMMEQVLALSRRAGKPLFLAFRNNRAYIAVNYGRALFEPGIASTTSLDAIQEMAAHFALAEGIVRELDLNTRIWTKGVDDSLLDRPDAAPETALELAANAGTLTPTQLWEAATAGVADAIEKQGDEVAPAPASTSIAIIPGPGTTTINYGLSFGVYLLLAISLASAAVWLAAAPAMPRALSMPELAPFTTWMPTVPYASALVAGSPLPWFLVASVLGPFMFFGWGLRVRKLEIGRDVVRIWRGFRPIPRTYARPTYGRVVRHENAVFLGKTSGLNLVNASASPMLRDDEALWVASELRRALKETAS